MGQNTTICHIGRLDRLRYVCLLPKRTNLLGCVAADDLHDVDDVGARYFPACSLYDFGGRDFLVAPLLVDGTPLHFHALELVA